MRKKLNDALFLLVKEQEQETHPIILHVYSVLNTPDLHQTQNKKHSTAGSSGYLIALHHITSKLLPQNTR